MKYSSYSDILWEKYPSLMTNEIAFKIGKADFPRFYDSPIWKVNIEPFEYALFFNWGNPMQGAFENRDETWKCSWYFHGSLKDEVFNLENKKHYIRGVISSYAGKICEKCISFCFANSKATRDRVEKWADEILKDKFGGKKLWIMKKDEKPSCPMVVTLTIEADEEIINYLANDNQDNQSPTIPSTPKQS